MKNSDIVAYLSIAAVISEQLEGIDIGVATTNYANQKVHALFVAIMQIQTSICQTIQRKLVKNFNPCQY